jgi:asparagine synthetase B (glutamine-hydrolysing)
MCGIVAFFARRPPVDPAALRRATRALHHRGPDGARQWVSSDGRVGLGHARLSIIDLTTGDQPIANEDERIHVVVNGEFYDHDRYLSYPDADHPAVLRPEQEQIERMPVEMKVRGMTEKYVLREAAKPYLTETVYKRQKHPFLAPIESHGRMRELVGDPLRGPVLSETPFFDRAAVLRFLEAEPSVRGTYFATQLVLLSACMLQQSYGLA